MALDMHTSQTNPAKYDLVILFRARFVREAAITLNFHFTTLSERKVICPSHHPVELLSQIIQALLNTGPKRKISERDLL